MESCKTSLFNKPILKISQHLPLMQVYVILERHQDIA